MLWQKPNTHNTLHLSHAIPHYGIPYTNKQRQIIFMPDGQDITTRSYLTTSYFIAAMIVGTVISSLEGSNAPLRASSASARHPPCHIESDSLATASDESNRWSNAATRSSASCNGKRLVSLPMPLAADHRTTVSLSPAHTS